MPGRGNPRGPTGDMPKRPDRTLDALQRQALAGNDGAWQELIARYDQRVLVSVLAMGIRPSCAREIVQEAWMRLIEKQRADSLARLELPGLAIKQARFLALDQLRSSRKERSTEPLEDQRAISGVHPERLLASRDELSRMFALLDRFPPHKRRMFELFYGQHLSAARIAEQLGVTVQHVRQTLYETRRTLRAALEEE